MEVVGLDGREYSFVPSNKESSVSRRSKLHRKAFKVVQEVYPFDQILQEVSLPGSRYKSGNLLQADIFLPLQRIIVEVHGEQHFSFNPFFHKNKLEFHRAKARDQHKRDWCELNDFQLIELAYNESEEEWKEKLC